MSEFKQTFEEMQKTWTALKSTLDQQDAEIKRYGTVSGETKSQIERLNSRLDDLETKASRPAAAPIEEKGKPTLETKAFRGYLRKGVDSLGPDELKTLATDSDVAGGYLVPTIIRDRIIERLAELSPIRALATIETIGVGRALEIPKEGGVDFAAGWVGERELRPPTTVGSFALERIPVDEQYSAPRATQSMLDDTAFDVEGWIIRKVGTRLAQLEGAAFVSGSGVGQPKGLLTSTDITAVNSGHASLLTADGLISLFYSLPEAYVRNATFLMRRATVAAIRQLKDTQGQYLWQMSIAPGAPATILGMPYVEAPDMPAIAASAFPILFGDFRACYTIVDRQGINVLRDPYSAKPLVEFYITRRVGGQVVLAEAMRRLRVSV